MLRATAKSKRILGLLVILSFGMSLVANPLWLWSALKRSFGFGEPVHTCLMWPCGDSPDFLYVDPTLILFLVGFYIFAERLLLKGWGRGTPYSDRGDSDATSD